MNTEHRVAGCVRPVRFHDVLGKHRGVRGLALSYYLFSFPLPFATPLTFGTLKDHPRSCCFFAPGWACILSELLTCWFPGSHLIVPFPDYASLKVCARGRMKLVAKWKVFKSLE